MSLYIISEIVAIVFVLNIIFAFFAYVTQSMFTAIQWLFNLIYAVSLIYIIFNLI